LAGKIQQKNDTALVESTGHRKNIHDGAQSVQLEAVSAAEGDTVANRNLTKDTAMHPLELGFIHSYLQ